MWDTVLFYCEGHALSQCRCRLLAFVQFIIWARLIRASNNINGNWRIRGNVNFIEGKGDQAMRNLH